MSGRSKSFWFGVKGACKELGIGFACLWEVDWGNNWWVCWQENVREFGTHRQTGAGRQPGVPLVVLIDTELARSDDARSRNTLLGSAQQLEVAYLLANHVDFVSMTNEEFVHYMKEKALSFDVP
eukprot:CAMPEP_0171115462 /NCGR_PEP_ID=MMETSP0766_2-20121228/87919_1 /TAXON_ID=439317 /ORGANISM="Gambierdiscus australes, Strain CAWD 149" /LENGTH=123 /DNA_ID=CAMNT_0011577819 /DNA_START=293 /DNA_END=660 /DNA_ORIENTATION=-